MIKRWLHKLMRKAVYAVLPEDINARLAYRAEVNKFVESISPTPAGRGLPEVDIARTKERAKDSLSDYRNLKGNHDS
ncbi:hypothetical protein [Paenibacillus sp. S150]|uniref:hypothetical protein n=1 Tax=Paenibacillus sp. S150 TaxID=2749826 RepID=UPI001C58F8EE|nr:hypothetical protein [Paenibacillus sp. S150]MBW4083571.1 hypothetical protein [Paenibacillus sp. S150]